MTDRTANEVVGGEEARLQRLALEGDRGALRAWRRWVVRREGEVVWGERVNRFLDLGLVDRDALRAGAPSFARPSLHVALLNQMLDGQGEVRGGTRRVWHGGEVLSVERGERVWVVVPRRGREGEEFYYSGDLRDAVGVVWLTSADWEGVLGGSLRVMEALRLPVVAWVVDGFVPSEELVRVLEQRSVGSMVVCGTTESEQSTHLLTQALFAVLDAYTPTSPSIASRPVRLFVDDIFNVAPQEEGARVVIAGALLSGRLQVGDTLVFRDFGETVFQDSAHKVLGLEAFRRSLDPIHALEFPGSIGVLLEGDRANFTRGMIATLHNHTPALMASAEALCMLPSDTTFLVRSRPTLCVLALQSLTIHAHAQIIGEAIGEGFWCVRFVPIRPIPLVAGDDIRLWIGDSPALPGRIIRCTPRSHSPQTPAASVDQ